MIKTKNETLLEHTTRKKKNQISLFSNIKTVIILLTISFLTGGCTTIKGKDTFFTFATYVADKDLSARENLASFTSEPDVELLKKGYIPIGNIKVIHKLDQTYEKDPTTKARIAASRYGGDLIKLIVDKEKREKTELKKNKCLQTRRQQILAWYPFEAFNQWQDVDECTKWEHVTVKTKIILSSGQVWRHEPTFLEQWAKQILFASVQNGKTSWAKYLLENNYVSIKARDKFGWTILMYAAHYGGSENVALAQFLIEKKGADVNEKTSDGKTALMRASFSSQVEMIKLLIRYGADLHAKDKTGKVAMDFASEEIRKEMENWLIRREAGKEK